VFEFGVCFQAVLRLWKVQSLKSVFTGKGHHKLSRKYIERLQMFGATGYHLRTNPTIVVSPCYSTKFIQVALSNLS